MTDDIYDRLARCEGFDWGEGNAPKVQARHDVEPGECEQAFVSEPLLVFADPHHSQHEERWRALGGTLGGRRLHLGFTIRRKVLIRVLTARDMNRKERMIYEQAKTRFEEDPDVQV
ncbi:MAG: BrnT family toxin [Gemmatimonadetes bacterium]|nr:BrnT family toxin [Gemmatimonadota bacterium]